MNQYDLNVYIYALFNNVKNHKCHKPQMNGCGGMENVKIF